MPLVMYLQSSKTSTKSSCVVIKISYQSSILTKDVTLAVQTAWDEEDHNNEVQG